MDEKVKFGLFPAAILMGLSAPTPASAQCWLLCGGGGGDGGGGCRRRYHHRCLHACCKKSGIGVIAISGEVVRRNRNGEVPLD